MAVGAPDRWVGGLEIGSGWAAWHGFIGPNGLHEHYAAQAVLATESMAVIDGTGRRHEGRCILIEPGSGHRMQPGGIATLSFLEPAGAGPELPQLRRAIDAVPAIMVPEESPTSFWRRWLDRTPAAFDARIACAVESIDRQILDGTVSLPGSAGAAHLSVERFRHLFTAQTGMPFSRFVLWRRLGLAIRRLTADPDATAAAHESGFADSAHLSRTVRAMFGVSLTEAGLLSAKGRSGP